MEFPDREPWAWRKSSFSEPNNNSCVEVANASELVGVRDSKNADGPTLAFDTPRWRDFLDALTQR